MARKKPVPIITHTELLSRACRSLQEELEFWQKKFEAASDFSEEQFHDITDPIEEKIKAIKYMYFCETGTDM